MSGCHACPDLGTYPAIGIDRAAQLFREKARLYAGLPMTIVAPSSWIEQKARQSPLLGSFPILRIPNGLDGGAYAPRSREEARQRLGLPLHARVILFSAHILDNNPRKGGDVLMQALTILGPQKDWILALMGEGGESWRVPIPVHNLGFHSDPSDIARCYAAADVVVIPSVLENLPNTLIESLACGRVVVASDCGGMRDGVLHETTGLITRVGDAQDLARGLKAMLDADERRPAMEREARAFFEREFSAERELERIESLYFSLAARTAKQ
jgi:glycosyltransferase involved in cell wall biosynthesis